VSNALRPLLEGIVDYAGLFPPASLDVLTAARNYQSYRAGNDRWMLGRFVVGVARLPELRSTITRIRAKDEEAWPVSVVAPDAAAATSVLRATDDATLAIESVEVKARTTADIALVSKAASKAREAYIEVPLDGSTLQLLEAIAAAKLRAKVRTGGVTPDAFPPPVEIISFIRACLDLGIPFKATAGLHHAYPTAGEHGFLNLLAAAVFGDEEEALAAPPGSFELDEDSFRWGSRRAGATVLAQTRGTLFHSIGSCSFFEPVGELRELGML